MQIDYQEETTNPSDHFFLYRLVDHVSTDQPIASPHPSILQVRTANNDNFISTTDLEDNYTTFLPAGNGGESPGGSGLVEKIVTIDGDDYTFWENVNSFDYQTANIRSVVCMTFRGAMDDVPVTNGIRMPHAILMNGLYGNISQFVNYYPRQEIYVPMKSIVTQTEIGGIRYYELRVIGAIVSAESVGLNATVLPVVNINTEDLTYLANLGFSLESVTGYQYISEG